MEEPFFLCAGQESRSQEVMLLSCTQELGRHLPDSVKKGRYSVVVQSQHSDNDWTGQGHF